MDLKHYIAESEKQYHLRIKTVVPLDHELMDRIERAISKYQPIDISQPKKTIVQKHPMDFPNVETAEVWIIDVTLALPAQTSVMREDVRKALGCNETYVVVRYRNEAIELETLRQNALGDIEEEAERRGLKPAALLSNNPDYIEADEVNGNDLFGTAYNGALLHYLSKVEDERREARVATEPGSTLFRWIDTPDREDQQPVQDTRDFNADISGAPKIKPKTAPRGVKIPDTKSLGNLDGQKHVVRRVFLDKNGKKVILSRELGGEE